MRGVSIEQARLVYRFIRAELEPKGGYSLIDSTTRIGITHKAEQHPLEGTVQQFKDGVRDCRVSTPGGG